MHRRALLPILASCQYDNCDNCEWEWTWRSWLWWRRLSLLLFLKITFLRLLSGVVIVVVTVFLWFGISTTNQALVPFTIIANLVPLLLPSRPQLKDGSWKWKISISVHFEYLDNWVLFTLNIYRFGQYLILAQNQLVEIEPCNILISKRSLLIYLPISQN